MSITYKYKKQVIKEFANKVKSHGFDVYLSDNEEYGFYTDKDGKRVCSFQTDFLSIKLSGNYRAVKYNDGYKVGSGWLVYDPKYGDLPQTKKDLESTLYANAPRWAKGDVAIEYTTLKQHLERYQRSSKYTKI